MSGDSSDVSSRDDSAGVPGVQGETTVVSGGSFSTTDVGPSTPWEAWLSNNSIKLWSICNLHVIILLVHTCNLVV